MTDLFPPTVDPFTEARKILLSAIDQYAPVAIVGLFSGGGDSLCATHVAASVTTLTMVAHIDTETGIRQTRLFVEDQSDRWGWPLKVFKPPMITHFGDGKKHPRVAVHPDAKTAFEAYCYHFGFPGPAHHYMVYNRLKDRCVAQITRECKQRSQDKVLFVSGVRRSESKRRMGYACPVQVEGARVWVAPMLFWEDADKERYMSQAGLEKSEVSKRLCISGECLCGCYASPGELAEIEHYYPESAAYLNGLATRLRAAGVKRCVWGAKPEDKPEAELEEPLFSIAGLCWGCERKWEKATEAT